MAEHDDGHCRAGADLLHELDAVQARQEDVDDEDVGKLAVALPQRVLGRFGRRHLEAPAFETDGQRPPNVRFIVDDENACAWHGSPGGGQDRNATGQGLVERFERHGEGKSRPARIVSVHPDSTAV